MPERAEQLKAAVAELESQLASLDSMDEETRGLLVEAVDEIQQACLTPLAYTIGTDFKRALRPEPDSIIHWDTW